MTNGKLIVFTRYPEPGRTKTRLISALGAQGAADLHRQMAQRAVRTARAAVAGNNVDVEICFTGGDEQKMREWLGADLRYSPQVGHDLGARMANAVQLSFHEGCRRVVLIGTDCPELTGVILDKAFALLEQHDAVIGPAHDGGYYLIGMARACLRVFTAIPWGTAKVLQATLDALKGTGTSWALVDRLVDVDTTEDLVVWEKVASAARNDEVTVSVIIPALNEASRIADKVIPCPRGRAWQMNAGAAAATGDVLLFLHADTRLPPNALANIASVMKDGRYIGGAFDLGIDSDRLFLRYIGARASFRSRVSRIPYGDQAIFIHRKYFDSVG